LFGTVAHADDVIVTSADDTIELTDDGDGAVSGEITITNASSVRRLISFEGAEDIATCAFKVEPAVVQPWRTVTVKVTSESCDVSANAKGSLLLAGATPSAITLKVKPGDSPASIPYWKVAASFGAGSLVSLVAVGVILLGRPKVKVKDKAPEVRVPVTTELEEPADDWDFTDSWASTISIGATVFVALFGATDVLTAVFGEEPKDVLNRLLVVSVVAAFAVGAGPLLVKSIGKTSKPTIRGVLVGAFATMLGVIGQIIGAGWTIVESEADMWVRTGAGVLAVFALAVTFWYSCRSLLVLFQGEFGPVALAVPEVTDELLLVAATIFPDDVSADPAARRQVLLGIATELAYARAGQAPPVPETNSYPDVTWSRTSPGDRPAGRRRRSVVL